MRKFTVLTALCILIAGCLQGRPAGAQSPSEDLRWKATLGIEHYNSLPAARNTLWIVTAGLLHADQFAKLETLMAEIEASKMSYGDFRSPLQHLYFGFAGDDPGNEVVQDYYFERWIEHSPQSKYAHLAQASARSQMVFDDLNWQTFEQRQQLISTASKAIASLNKAAQIPKVTDDPEYWESRMKVALVMGAPAETVEKLLQEVVARDPQRWSAYYLRLLREAPRFGGNVADYLKTLDRLTSDYGPEVYPVCVWSVLSTSGFNDLAFRQIGFDWDRIEKGFDALNKRSPYSGPLLNYRARLALASGQDEKARDYLDNLGDNLSLEIFIGEGVKLKVESLLAGRPRTVRPELLLPTGPEKAIVEAVPDFRISKFIAEIDSLVADEHFRTLDRIPGGIRGNDAYLYAFYSRLLRSEGDRDQVQERWNRWSTISPGSFVANTMLARHLMKKGWEARGGGWAKDVTPEAWKTFQENLNRAAPYLEAPGDAAGCQARINLAIGRGEPPEEVDKWVARAKEIDPESTLALGAKCTYLMPRWHGTPQKLEAFLTQIMAERGDAVLPPVLSYSGNYNILFEELPTSLLERGFAAEPPPDLKGGVAMLEAEFERGRGDRKKTLEALKIVEEQDAVYSWAVSRFPVWKKWAQGQDVLK